jgi:hypothetical protein
VTTDDIALRAALAHQAAVLAPIRARLQEEVVHPPIAPHDWRGPAAYAYALVEDRLRSRIRAAEAVVEQALHHTRIAMGQLDG